MTTAIAYIRVSKDEQNYSLDMQRDQIERHCQLLGVTLVNTIVDHGVSAGKPLHKRPGGAELMTAIAEQDVDMVVAYAVDRMFRNTRDGLNVVRGDFEEAGVDLALVYDQVDTRTPDGKFAFTMKLAVAEYERDRTCFRTQAIFDNRKAAGKTCSGHTQYGLLVVGDDLYRCPEAWPVRERIQRWRLPTDGEGMSLQNIINALEGLGIESPTGRPLWNKNGIRRAVENFDWQSKLPMAAGQGA